MCGIVGCILKNNENVAPILFKCISNLEYRGYDSIGLATYDNKSKTLILEINKKIIKCWLMYENTFSVKLI